MRWIFSFLLSVALMPDTAIAQGSSDGSPMLLKANQRSVFDLAFSPGGKLIASAGEDGTVKLWEPGERFAVATFKGHKKAVYSLAFASRKVLLSGGQDGTIRLWDLKTGSNIQTLTGHSKGVLSLALSGNRKVILSGGQDKTLKVWDAKTGQNMFSFEAEGQVTGVAATRRLVAMASDTSGNIFMWDLKSRDGQPRREFFARKLPPIYAFALHPSEKFVAAAGKDGVISILTLPKAEVVLRMTGHKGPVQDIAFSRDGRFLLSGGMDGTVRFWDLQSGNQLLELRAARKSKEVYSVALSQKGYLLAGSAKADIAAWAVDLPRQQPRRRPPRKKKQKQQEQATELVSQRERWAALSQRSGPLVFDQHKDLVSSVAFSPNGELLISGGYDATLRMYHIESGVQRRIFRLNEENNETVTSVGFTPDSLYAVSGDRSNALTLWEIESKKQVRRFQGHSSPVTSLAVSADGTRLLSGSEDSTMRLWDLQTGTSLQLFEGHTDVVSSVALSSDGSRSLSGSYDLTASLWGNEGGEDLYLFENQDESINAVAFGSDEDFVFLAGDSTTIVQAKRGDGEYSLVFRGHDDSVTGFALSPDGSYAVSGSLDGTLILWDTKTAEMLHRLEGHEGAVNGVAFSPGGYFVASAGDDRTVRLWPVPADLAPAGEN